MKKLEFWFHFALGCWQAWQGCVEKYGNPFAKPEETPSEGAKALEQVPTYQTTEK